ncbi:hypothetical protein DPMN_098423 [Dreissena polymorpha]|uniref:Uncharacterized protein n=1 Tax=Dreissena polymorpha TaxID=45954 RepID=A0A9D4R6B1_DREPO|nr:hypothetical protein DPMN_098423 [Dreissena polymorpha]
MAESSAYKSNLADISFTWIKNNKGPRMEPWGTPQEMFSDDEKVPDTSTSCFLSDKYDCNHIVISSPRPEARSFIKSIE